VALSFSTIKSKKFSFIVGEVMGIEREGMRLFEVEEPENFSVSHVQADLKMFMHNRPVKFVNSGWSTSNKKKESPT